MSGDVQPRKRKDKKRKRDSLDRKSEGELIFSRKSSLQSEDEEIIHHGVHATKMGTEDVHLHVQSEHGTGGNWCAKIFFFSLMAILVGLVGLIIMENRGLSDLDTPLQESRFSEYFEGWVDEHREEHHDDHNIVAHEIEEHDLHDEPFEEVEENDSHGADDDDEDEHDAEETHEVEGDDHDDEDEDEEDNKTAENDETAEDDLDEDDEIAEDDDNDNDDNDDDDNIEPSYTRTKRDTQLNKEPESSKNDKEEEEDDDDDDDDDENKVNNDNNKNDDDNDDGDDDDDDKNKDNDDPFDEEEYDGTFESLEENIVDNDAEELRLLQKKAEQAAKNNNDADSEEHSSTPPLAVKIIVGLALALVARLVLIKKRPEDVTRKESIDETISIEKIQTNEEINQSTELLDETDQPLDGDYYEDEEEIIYSENEDFEEEIEEIEEEEEEDETEIRNVIKTKLDEDVNQYVPETFEQLNAMYRPVKNIPTTEKDPKLQVDVKLQTTKTIEFKPRFDENKNFDIFKLPNRNIDNLNRIIKPDRSNLNSSIEATSIREKIVPKVSSSSQQIDNSIEEKIIAAKLAASTAQPESLIESDEYGDGENDDDNDDILGEEEIYEEEVEEEEEEDDDDGAEVSDDGDDELMKRLEAKYGKLPVNFDSEEGEVEEDEEEDPSWTKIKPRSGGAQSYSDDDLLEAELQRAEEQINKKNFKAGLKIYESLALKYPESREALYGKAIAMDNLANMTGSIDMLKKSIAAFQRFLALDELIPDDEFKISSYYCISQMRSIHHYQSAVPIHMELVKRFDDDPNSRNELVITYLYLDRFSDAKDLLEENLKKWPKNGLSLVNYGYILAYEYKDLEKGVHNLRLGIETGENGTQEQLFYSVLGQSLLTLNRTEEARDIFRIAVAKKLFISEYQRPFTYTKDLKAQPFWTKEEIGYTDCLNLFESNWRQIREEGISLLTEEGYFYDENEKLTIAGRWQEFALISHGKKIIENCKKAAFTCALSEICPAARHCITGQIKFSVIHPGTHIKPHCGPCNSRLRAHLGLKVPSGTRIRVVNKERSWEEGKFLIFDDSFEHEVWHNGSSLRLVLIVDFWHPQITNAQKELLSNGPKPLNEPLKWTNRLSGLK